MSDFNIILINGSLLLGSIYSLLIMINRVLKTLDKECKLILKLSIIANEKMFFRMQNELMNIDGVFAETYYLGKVKKHEISFHFNAIDNNEINKFTNRFLGLFASENQKSTKPFLSVTIDETRGFYHFLLQYDKYLMINN
jgi:alpha-glucuronidase